MHSERECSPDGFKRAPIARRPVVAIAGHPRPCRCSCGWRGRRGASGWCASSRCHRRARTAGHPRAAMTPTRSRPLAARRPRPGPRRGTRVCRCRPLWDVTGIEHSFDPRRATPCGTRRRPSSGNRTHAQRPTRAPPWRASSPGRARRIAPRSHGSSVRLAVTRSRSASSRPSTRLARGRVRQGLTTSGPAAQACGLPVGSLGA
jgi:hypothetical protein